MLHLVAPGFAQNELLIPGSCSPACAQCCLPVTPRITSVESLRQTPDPRLTRSPARRSPPFQRGAGPCRWRAPLGQKPNVHSPGAALQVPAPVHGIAEPRCAIGATQE